MTFSHTQSSAQLWAEDTGFYQCHSSINAEQLLTVMCQLVGRRQKSSCRVDEDRRLEDECPSSPADTKGSKCGDDKEIGS